MRQLQACRPDGRKILREARRYRHLFSQHACGWCLKKLAGQGTVDHDHACCDLPSGKCCLRCVRGLVHLRCNQEIAWIEQLRKRGYRVEVSAHQQGYLTTPLFRKSLTALAR